MNCVVCQGKHKYKCSKCRAPYCSVTCCQTHNQHCLGMAPAPAVAPVAQQQEEDIIVKTDYLSDEELRIPADKLLRLKMDIRVRTMLKNPALRERLVSIDNSKQRMTEVL